MMLSSWLRDHLYIPLGGNRRGPFRTYANLLAAMLLGGLWHGASWTFVLWGLYNGLGLAGHRLWVEHVKPQSSRAPVTTLLGWTVTFIFVCGGWIVFRSPDVATAVAVFGNVLGIQAGGLQWFFLPSWILLPIVGVAHLLGVIGARARVATRDEMLDVLRIRRPTRSMVPMRLAMPAGTIAGAFVVTAWLIMLFLFSPLSHSPFIYFRF
jgi:alginate O-acetyltransferase complex protein AlgI